MSAAPSNGATDQGGCLVKEDALVFHATGRSLVGVLSRSSNLRRTGMLIVTGGPQYRVGSHRLFVSLARSVAAGGNPVFRFDYGGMGDSEGTKQSFDSVSADIGAAVDAFAHAVPGMTRVVLWGLCDGASAALLYLSERRDPRVAGLVLLNPWVRTAAGQARTHVKHYYLQRVRERAFWIKLANGKVAWSALSGLARNVAAAFGIQMGSSAAEQDFTGRMADAWVEHNGPVLLMLSEHDFGAREFEEHVHASSRWQQALKTRAPERIDLVGADHTCSTKAAKVQLISTTCQWLERLS